MKIQAIGTFVAGMLASSYAFGADPVGKIYTPEVPVSSGAYDWTGFYAGATVGYGFGGQDNVHTKGQAAPNIANIAGGARPGFVNLDRDGMLGGIEFGYNQQFRNFVAGAETDFSFTDFRDTRDIGTRALVGGAALNNRFTSEIDNFGTVRARLGFTYDRALFYATGGLAYGETKQRVDMFGAAGSAQFSGSKDDFKVGYAVGAGVEYAVTERFSLKGEYLYYDLGRSKLDVAVIPGSGGAGTGYDSRFYNNGQIFRVGLNYTFN